MTYTAQASQLADFIKSLPSFRLNPHKQYGYDHMGATITDAGLQAGLNYRTVVRPRAEKLMREYPEACTTAGFLEMMETKGIGELLSWNHPDKPRRIWEMTVLFHSWDLQTEAALHEWLCQEENDARLLKIHGVGLKTVDYLKILVGVPTVAVDRHVRTFVAEAGVGFNKYEDIRSTVCCAADMLGVNKISLDKAIWSYVSGML